MKLIKTITLTLGLIFFLTGCYKAGCTDSGATNYNPDVKTEDLSCTYTGNLVFWTTIIARDSLINLGHVMLRFELEGELVDSMATSGFSTSTGECSGGGTKTIVRNFAGNTERNYKYRIKGFGFETIYEGFVLVTANDCAAVKFN